MVVNSGVRGTSLLEALDFFWDYSSKDLTFLMKYNQLSFKEKINKIFNDCIVYLVSSLLKVNLEKCGDKKFEKLLGEYSGYVESNSFTELNEKSIILVLNGDSDLPVSPKVFEQLKIDLDCQIKFIKVKSFDDLDDHIDLLKQTGNRIEALWIRAHGSSFSIDFHKFCNVDITPLLTQHGLAKNFYEDKNTVFELFLRQLSKLEEKAPIILESCHTGQLVEEGLLNIAQFIANAADGRTVYAPSREALRIEEITKNPKTGFKVSIKSHPLCKTYPKGSLLGRITVIWYAFRNRKEEITREFKKAL
jgi:hypothetical protein